MQALSIEHNHLANCRYHDVYESAAKGSAKDTLPGEGILNTLRVRLLLNLPADVVIPCSSIGTSVLVPGVRVAAPRDSVAHVPTRGIAFKSQKLFIACLHSVTSSILFIILHSASLLLVGLEISCPRKEVLFYEPPAQLPHVATAVMGFACSWDCV